MKIKISINGTEISAEISDDDAKKIGVVKGKKTGYERVIDDCYFYVNAIGYVPTVADDNEDFDNNTYNIGNYYNSEELAWSNARADQLSARMRQWQAAKDKAITKKDWENEDIKKYCISYDYSAKELIIEECWEVRQTNVIYFSTQEKAQEAIKQFREDLLWYYTKYQQRLDEE